MSLRSRLATVDLAEAECAARRAGIAAAWNGFKLESERAATPGRVVGAGLVAGFVSGLGGTRSAPSGSGIGGKVFSMLLEKAIAGLGEGLAAGAAFAEAETAGDAQAPRPAADRD